MAENSNIEWTDHTFNPWRGCTKVSPGCANCYAETLSKRNPKLLGEWGPGKPRVLASEKMWREPLKWNEQTLYQCSSCWQTYHRNSRQSSGWECYCSESEPTVCETRRMRVFCASLADWLDDEVSIEWLVRLLMLIRETPNLDWLLLTKRPQNFKKRMQVALKLVLKATGGEPCNEADFIDGWINKQDTIPPNVWIGTTVEDQQRANERIQELLKIPAMVRFLSCEPLLDHVDLTQRQGVGFAIPEGIHWVICGGESGPKARPMHPDWARSLRDQCRSAGVPFFFKQWGEWSPCPIGDGPDHVTDAVFKKGPAFDGAVWKVGKEKAGRTLDGEIWDQFPDQFPDRCRDEDDCTQPMWCRNKEKCAKA